MLVRQIISISRDKPNARLVVEKVYMLSAPTIHVKFVKWTAGVETEYILSDSFYVFTHKALPILGKAFRV